MDSNLPTHLSQQGTGIFVNTSAAVDTASVRREQLNGDDHLVAPVVMLVEGTLAPSNSDKVQFAPASVFARFEGRDWNGRPITLGHPKDVNGIAISANSGTVVEQEQIGSLFNCYTEDKKLKGELWINLEKTKELDRDEINNRVQALENGEVVEVSVGVFVMTLQRRGVYENQQFDEVWLEAAADHIAVLAEGDTGACSVEDGCGAPRINEANPKKTKKSKVLKAAKGALNKLKGKQACGCGGGGNSGKACSCESPESQQAVILQTNAHSHIEKFYANGGSFQDIALALMSVMSEVQPNFAWLVSIYDDYFVYETWESLGFFARSYGVKDDGIITIGAEAYSVRPETTYVPVTVEVDEMNVPEFVNSLIANEKTRFEESDRAFLEGLSEDQLKKLEPVVAEATESETAAVAEPESEPEATTSIEPIPEGNKPEIEEEPEKRTIEKFLEAAPNEVREVVQEGLQARESKRTDLMAQIKAFKGNPFNDDELSAKSTDELSKIAAMAYRPDYTGASGAKQTTTKDALDVNRPPQVFQVGKPNGAAGQPAVTV